MKRVMAVLCLVMLLSISLMAEERKADGTASDGAIKADRVAPGDSSDPAKSEATSPKAFSLAVEPTRPINGLSEGRGEIPKGVMMRNALLMAALWGATAVDIHSSKRMDPTRFQETNQFGGVGGQIATSAIATGTAYLIQRYGPRHMQWLGSALLAGGAAARAR